MNDICRLALDLTAFRVFGKPLETNLKYNEEILRKLYAFSRLHDIDNIVGSALINSNAFEFVSAPAKCEEKLPKGRRDGDMEAVFAGSVATAVFKCEKFKSELNEISEVFEKEKIENIPLKGSVIRGLYPDDWLRTSCDLDILIKENAIESAVNALIGGLSYKLKQRGEYEVSLFSPSGVHIELHYALAADEVNKSSRDILNNVWDYVIPGEVYTKRLTDEFFYFYHIAHMAKHFVLGGCGMRPFIDLKIMNDKLAFNREKLNRMLEDGGLKKFEEAAVKLSHFWFENGDKESLGEEICSMSDYVLYAGAYGSIENRVIVCQNKAGGKFGYAMSRIFLPYGVMKKMHPILEKHKWLLPWFEVRRWFVVLFDGRAKRAIKELKCNAGTNFRSGEKFRDMMNKLELN